jgi:hypothetical protein
VRLFSFFVKTRFLPANGKWNFGALLALLLILVFVPNGVREPLMLIIALVWLKSGLICAGSR